MDLVLLYDVHNRLWSRLIIIVLYTLVQLANTCITVVFTIS